MSSTTSSNSTSATGSLDSSGLTRYFGLASGLDVDTIVKGLMARDQSRIDAANQRKQILLWKQEAYQAITTSLRTFESTYLSLSSASSMLASSAYGTYTGTSSSDILAVSGNSSAEAGTHSVRIYQSAITSSVTGAEVSPAITGTVDTRGLDLSGTSFFVTVDGVKREISFGAGEVCTEELLNSKLKAVFGMDPEGLCKVAATVDANGRVSIDAGGGYQAVVSVSSGSGSDALARMGIASGSSNRISTGATLQQLFGSRITAQADGNFTVGVNGKSITLCTSDTLTEALSKINAAGAGVTAAYDSLADRVSVKATTGGAAGAVSLDDKGTGFFTAVLGDSGSRTVTSGRDAIFSIDGTRMTRGSNDFTVNGVAYSIKRTVNYNANPDDIEVTLTSNIDDAVTNIKKFVDAYNKLITDMNNAVGQKPDANYKPLTDSQKEKMSDDAINKWTEQAKKGVIFSDSTVTNILTRLRQTVNSSVTTSSGRAISLSDIGITTGDYSEKGQLHVDETKLRAALKSDSRAVMELFNQASDIPYSTNGTARTARTSEEGIAYRLQDIIKDATGTSGSLIRLAGMPNESSEQNNSIYEQLKQINRTIDDYQKQFKSNQTKYYNQFTNLEMYIARMNQQSAYLSSWFSSWGNE